MHGANGSIAGWGASELKTVMNSSIYNSIGIKSYIKQVEKYYCSSRTNKTIETSSDYLWVLSCAEIYPNKTGWKWKEYTNGAIEGSIYKFWRQKFENSEVNSNFSYLEYPGSSVCSWLRTMYKSNSGTMDDWCYFSNRNGIKFALCTK